MNADTVTIQPWHILVFIVGFLAFILIVGWLLEKVMPPASFDTRPWPTPPRFPPGKVGEFMAEEELRRGQEHRRR